MAYQALYRKYRPENFEGVAGQKAIVQTLNNAIKQNKIAHAYLFCGPRGTGKTSIAKIFAKMLNCENHSESPCGHCQNCIDFQKGTHPDVIEIDAASNNGVDEVRNLIEKVKYAPIEGKYKVYIIDEVHMMSTGAFNALLKTIEEPPTHVVFIFATTEPHKVLPTIISRCQRYDFHKVSVQDMKERLNYIVNQENIHVEDNVIETIARLADGGMRDALSILDQCIAYAQNHITLHDIHEIYGIISMEEKSLLIENIIHGNSVDLVHQIENLSEKGIDIRRLTNDLIELIKESLIYSFTKASDLVASSMLKMIKEKLDQIPIDRRLNMLDILMDTSEKFRYASDVVSYFEIAVMKMLSTVKEVASDAAIDSNQNFSSNRVVQQSVIQITEEQKQNFINNADKKEDVSRETSTANSKVVHKEEPLLQNQQENVVKKKVSLKIDDQYIIRLLVGANKQERQMDDEKFKELDEYLNELEWAKYANSLKNTEIVASGKNYLVLSTNSEIEAKEINQIESENSYIKFTNQLLGLPKKIFAIDENQKKKVITKFKELMIQGNLPEPIQIEIKTKKENKIKQVTIEDKLSDLFGDEIVIMED